MMKITLRIDGKDKEFTQSFIPFSLKKEALKQEIEMNQEGADPIENLDMKMDFLVRAFGNQFTREELENGMNTIGSDDVFYETVGVNVLGFMPLKELKKQQYEQQKLGKLMLEKEARKNKKK
ncbi:hypothetical protein MM326_15230 [Alkalihalobacillus sp. LMS6]|uniref:phage tail assembly chaperone G n=1 Tax=Alkalihalobacillus sp. LMS6 TaxID=2924034 RepID=UPI0020D18224|nr:hypothetical protein [Alkalihalobacillus sp. LMS6]UTR05449.1 hypothetical protein MM326_15230 [Alkalihalobacillus sp. LMS6]